VKTLFVAYRVTDLERSLDFYTTLGYVDLGRVTFDDGGSLAVLKFPHEPVATLELVHRPDLGRVDVGGFDHLAIQVDDLTTTQELLIGDGLEPSPLELPAGGDGPRTAWLTDPDGYRIELVEWPPGHPDGITAADFPDGEQD
jgi:lactoylglutathione lyase